MHNFDENIHVLTGTLEMMELFLKSPETLKNDENFDFMVYSYNRKSIEKEMDLEIKDMCQWETSILINRQQYNELHSNLCKKLRAFGMSTVGDPKNQFGAEG